MGAAHISHFAAMVIFALLVSLALASLTRRSTLERIKYAAWSLLLFIAVGVGIAWLMYPLSH
jgi:hypothetical protein